MNAEDDDRSVGDENERLRERLREAEETLDAIRNGDVDAVVVSGADNLPRIYTLETADRSYRRLVEEMQEGALTLTAAGEILYCNPRLAALLDQEPARIIGTSFRRFVAGEDWPVVLELISTGGKREFMLLVDSDRAVSVHLSFSALHGDESSGETGVFCCIVTDLTEQRRTGDELRAAHDALLGQVAEREKTEALLRQSQKMEAVGQLTGGVAHDFNNLLMVITGGLAMLRREPTAERRTRLLEGMRQAAERGAALTRQLLAFSRGKELHPGPIDLPTHLSGLRELLDRSLGSVIAVQTQFERGLWPVRVDAGEFEIALLNLCVNARDAMPKGGVITITGRNCAVLTDADSSGDFVLLSVQDSGTGMSPETMSRCLEPFYTTKEVGKGSGLGLAQVYGFAQASGGSVNLESEVGIGTTVSSAVAPLFRGRNRSDRHR